MMYRFFVQPTMECANVVWGGIYGSDLMKLECIHLLDSMIVGPTARSNIVKVWYEFGGYTVQDHIDTASLSMMYKIVNKIAPGHLLNILPNINGQRHYRLGNNSKFRVPKCRLETYNK